MATDEPAHVIDHVFLGSRAHAKDRELLEKLQITHILNVTPPKKVDPSAGVPNFFEKDKKFVYRRCPIYDNRAEDISGVLAGSIAFMEQAKFYGRILVHCNKGVSRSVSIVIAYLIQVHDMTYSEALTLVQAKREVAQPNPSFESQLQSFAGRAQQESAKKRREEDATGSSKPNATTTSTSTTKASIGPRLPPHLMKMDQGDEPSKASEGANLEEVAPSTSSIGPAMPPGLRKRKTQGDNDEEQEPRGSLPAHRSIGPNLPPHLKKNRRNEANTDVEEADRSL